MRSEVGRSLKEVFISSSLQLAVLSLYIIFKNSLPFSLSPVSVVPIWTLSLSFSFLHHPKSTERKSKTVITFLCTQKVPLLKLQVKRIQYKYSLWRKMFEREEMNPQKMIVSITLFQQECVKIPSYHWLQPKEWESFHLRQDNCNPFDLLPLVGRYNYLEPLCEIDPFPIRGTCSHDTIHYQWPQMPALCPCLVSVPLDRSTPRKCQVLIIRLLRGSTKHEIWDDTSSWKIEILSWSFDRDLIFVEASFCNRLKLPLPFLLLGWPPSPNTHTALCDGFPWSRYRIKEPCPT